jgi:hypothetical protein
MDGHHTNTLLDMNYRLGVQAERIRIMELLRDKHVLRDSMFGDEKWLVLYTMYGAIDISLDELNGVARHTNA